MGSETWVNGLTDVCRRRRNAKVQEQKNQGVQREGGEVEEIEEEERGVGTSDNVTHHMREREREREREKGRGQTNRK